MGSHHLTGSPGAKEGTGHYYYHKLFTRMLVFLTNEKKIPSSGSCNIVIEIKLESFPLRKEGIDNRFEMIGNSILYNVIPSSITHDFRMSP